MSWISQIIVFISSFILTGLMRKLCLFFNIVDYPSERRTHKAVTPRGGGVAIVMVFISLIIFFNFSSDYYYPLLPAFILAFIGFWDDVRSLPARLRLAMQFFCAITSIYLIGDSNIFHQILGVKLPFLFCVFLATLFIVWFTNLYNFMDGVNGLAGVEALCLSLFMGYLFFNESQYEWCNLWLILASATAGFLVWNFPQAKIFLGDIGSYFFGFSFSILLIKAATLHTHWFWSGIIVLGYFIVDATLTLLIRVWNRFSFLEPHRTHAYQLLWKKFNQNHAHVTMTILILNIFWLMPWAYVVAKGYFQVLYALLISYSPLFYLVFILRASYIDALGAMN